jgi:hypothetical protein
MIIYYLVYNKVPLFVWFDPFWRLGQKSFKKFGLLVRRFEDTKRTKSSFPWFGEPKNLPGCPKPGAR